MIKSIRNLKKLDDILNSEGTILGLYQYRGKLYLSSNLNDNSGEVYYSVDALTLARYYNNELRLREIYLASEDTVVPCRSEMGTIYFIKEELTDQVACGDRLFLENSSGLRSDRFADLFKKLFLEQAKLNISKTGNNEMLIDTTNLNNLVEEVKLFVSRKEADHEIERRLKQSSSQLNNCFVAFNPNRVASGIEKPALIILGPDYRFPIHPSVGVFLMCTEGGAHTLRNEVRSYLAFKRVEEIHRLGLDAENRMDLRYLQEVTSKSIDSAIVEAWSIVLRLADSRSEFLTLDKAELEANLTLQLTRKIFPALNQKGWLHKS